MDIASPIYKEIIPRELTYGTQISLSQQTAWYVQADGSLDTEKLIAAFQDFFRERSEAWLERFAYKEAGPHADRSLGPVATYSGKTRTALLDQVAGTCAESGY